MYLIVCTHMDGAGACADSDFAQNRLMERSSVDDRCMEVGLTCEIQG